MKKRKIIGVVFSICVFALFTALPIDVSAVTEYGENCTQNNAKTKYAPAVTEDNNTYKVTVKDGSFNVNVTGTTEMNQEVTKDKPMVIPFDSQKAVFLKIVLTVNNSDDLCLKNTSTEADKASEGSAIFVFTIARDVPAGKVENTSYNGICKAFREGTSYGKYFQNSDISKNKFDTYNYKASNAEDKKFYENYLSYCFNDQVDTDYDETLVKTMIINVMNIVYLNHNSSGVVTNFDQTFEDLWNSAVDTTSATSKNDAITLKCDPFKTETLPGEDYYTNQNRYRKQTESTENSCKKTCREVVTVQYGPPVASKAGLCFEYKVKIQSKVNCSTEFTGRTMPTMPETCTPYPRCNTSNHFADQGGPNEEFDECVNSCDGGKYTQSCINKCYKKVYDSSTESTTMLSYQSSPKVQKLSNPNYMTVYNEKKKNPGGRYERVGNTSTIIWVPDTTTSYYYAGKLGITNLNDLAIYYFSTPELTQHTLAGLRGEVWNYDNLGPYYAKNGFKVAQNCEDVCQFLGCENTNANPNMEEAMEEYNAALEQYIHDRDSCEAKASCETNTSEFKMSVNTNYYNKAKKKIEKKTINFPSSRFDKNETSSKDIKFTDVTDNTCKFTPNGESVIIDQGGQCYGCSNNKYDYMTEISFPGTWRNNKTGEISYIPQNKTTWFQYENKFCTPETSLDVNTKWFEWKFNNTCYTKTEVNRSIDYNIFAELYNFGYMKWYFKVQCFYALKADSSEISEKNCSSCDPTKEVCTDDDDDCDPTREVCEEGHIDDYTFRNVNLANLFPENGTPSNYSNTGRTPGFNWSADATNLNNTKYEVTPTALIQAVQERQNDIYSSDNEDKYLDYEFVLDKSTINAIRKYNQNRKYTQYEGSTKVVNGVRVYSSNLFRNSGIVSANKTGVLGCNNQSGSGNTCETFTDDYVNSLRGGVK